MNRFVVMVDAGYLLRQSIEIVSSGASSQRADLQVTDPAALVAVVIAKARATLALDGKELLRVYWYDGVLANGLTPQQRAIIDVDDVQFRAGTVNSQRQQKGVDSLIVSDLIELTSHRAISDAVLVTGDGDLAVGIELAQRRGVRIAVIGVEDAAAGVFHSQSHEITMLADRVGRIGADELAPVLLHVPAAAASTEAGLTLGERAEIEAAVKDFLARQPSHEHAIDPVSNTIERSMDRLLLHHLYTELARGKLSDREKIYARDVFRANLNP